MIDCRNCNSTGTSAAESILIISWLQKDMFPLICKKQMKPHYPWEMREGCGGKFGRSGRRGGRHSFRAARFSPPHALGFRDEPLRAVYVGALETKGLWDRVGFREVPLRAAREGHMETKGTRNVVGFQNRPLRPVYVGVLETKGPWDRVGFREGPLRGV